MTMKIFSAETARSLKRVEKGLKQLSDDPEFRVSYDEESNVCDMVFAGGGAKGVAHLGALWAFDKLNIRIKRLAGTSAGAINAALVAAGYDIEELYTELFDLDFMSFRDGFWDKHLPKFARIAAVSSSYGMYEGENFQKWIEKKLVDRNANTFGRLPMEEVGMLAKLEPGDGPRLCIMASDVTHSRELLMPRDLVLDRYGNLRPPSFPVSAAVRMSISVPFFFTPYKLHKSLIVDGAFASNLPLETFDKKDPEQVRWPTFGMNLVSEVAPAQDTGDLFHFGLAVFDTMRYGQSRMSFMEYPTRICRLFDIRTGNVRTLDFGIKREQKEELFLNGARTVLRTLRGVDGAGLRRTWNFDSYLKLRKRWGFPPMDEPYL
jgi:NTE family protein